MTSTKADAGSLMISIILCTRDRAPSLAPTLHSLAATCIPQGWQVEVLIVDNGSTDSTPRVVEDFAQKVSFQVRSLNEERPGKSHALNTGVREAKGEILLFTDDDIRFPPNWIEGMCQPIAAGEADAVQGGIRWAPHLLERCLQPHYAYLPRVITSTRHKSPDELRHALIGANMAIATTVFSSVRPFDPRLGPGALGLGEETLVGWEMLRCGFRLVQALNIEVEHHFDPSRLSRRGLLRLAEAKGRSLGYLQHHWERRAERMIPVKRLMLVLKDLARTAVSPSAWIGRALIPEWKYSYRADLSRLRQLALEKNRSPSGTLPS